MNKKGKWGVIFNTRDRADILRKTLPVWAEQDLPMALIVEPDQEWTHVQLLAELGLSQHHVFRLPLANKGVGYARRQAVKLAQTKGLTSFILSDDDTKPTHGDVRCLLRFTDARRGMICAGWMSNYGQWVPGGNELVKNHDNIVIPRGGANDHVMSLNTELVLGAGNYLASLDAYHENTEINRQGIRSGHMWYIHTGLRIAMVNKPKDPGGLSAYIKNAHTRKVREHNCHKICWKRWPQYVSPPSKRYSCKWGKLLTDYISEIAARAVQECWRFEEKDVVEALEMYR